MPAAISANLPAIRHATVAAATFNWRPDTPGSPGLRHSTIPWQDAAVEDAQVVRVLKTTPVFDTYWRFASERQTMFMRRVLGRTPPWTEDPILSVHRFTNTYRASDRVSQYLIRHVIYEGSQKPEEVFFRTILFKLFNRIDTWETLRTEFGAVSWREFTFEAYAKLLDRLLDDGQRIYSAAYIMPSPAFGSARKHRNHLRLIEHMIADGAPRKLAEATSLRAAFELLRGYPSLGDFLAFQFAIDLNYSELTDFSEMEFVVAWPGARDGIRKCFKDAAGLKEAEIIQVMADRADDEFERLGIQFQSLWGRRLQLIDCQNVFCEVSKYARVAHPDIVGDSGRTRIKQKFTPSPAPIPQWYPPKWALTVDVSTTVSNSSSAGSCGPRQLHEHRATPAQSTQSKRQTTPRPAGKDVVVRCCQ